MATRINLFLLFSYLLFTGCSKTMVDGASTSVSDRAESGLAASGGGSGNSGNTPRPGVITAGEWNDLVNWSFWDTLSTTGSFKTYPEYWRQYNNNRVSVRIKDNNTLPVADALVRLKKNGTTIFTAKTDNSGSAELWADLFQNNTEADYTKLTIDINNGAKIITNVKPYSSGVNTAVLASGIVANKIEIAFTVDATGSMGDELEYLKSELLNVIGRVKTDNPNASVGTASVFYRDEGDDYVTRISAFSNNINTTMNFIKAQAAGGGGDFPEAVHTALDNTVNKLQWSANAKTRLLFLLLDAPPHHNDGVISSLQSTVKTAAEKGIKIIPITASGINKETESLMRSISITTNGTYVFITNDSGIGNNHLAATVGAYQVEFLNNLMVRLINKYAK